MIISLTGAIGSGKSTIAQMLADKFGWPRYYIGGLRREAAQRRGLTLAEYNHLGETDIRTDQEVDLYQKKMGETQDDFVIEGRTSWYFIPHSFKIYLDVDPVEGARRVFGSLQKKNDRNEDKDLKTVQDVQDSIQKRVASDRLRYGKYYNIDVNDLIHYDFYLNTTNLSPEQVFEVVYKKVESELDNKKK